MAATVFSRMRSLRWDMVSVQTTSATSFRSIPAMKRGKTAT